MHLYKTPEGALLVAGTNSYLLNQDWDQLINQSDLHQHLKSQAAPSSAVSETRKQELIKKATAPIGSQEVWASGVTYLKSRDARMEESKESGAADVYQKVYDAERPELFFKSLPARVVGSGDQVFIRNDSTWNVPEPELTLFINSAGAIQAYTAGNDMSSRSIEGENPLYLPQAKMYERSCALGPCLYVPAKPISPETTISIKITRAKKEMFSNSVQLNRMKRNLPELAVWLYKALTFPTGSFLMTGTGIVPPNDFTLQEGDEIRIEIEGIGVLTNSVGVI
ncbi:MAG: fumarylacetoacetate hydrolase family protein [Cyclobacteriaceae bacterium]|nr:fumarylacetoacetate hydrolase family protein [Cyclobacteriaceae bacterium]